ncbi:bifunctional adenosylcobinamide kinase/adenosylcobinamide-phosphate guanylyltransferase [Pseudogemmobacter sp. W21_MBD1_M6]|uniref:bifunctional adenosylcobinamide kinase/adenosylcobinamide-phosphate guanylyltransferase n=1 Tax=Pseudogemmobacter sp. W21_MBD1_M6 TaxID=3240271 RepID=UPI003F985E0A
MLPKLTFVLGGASSGKSGLAERLVVKSGLEKIYLATAQAFDDEMRAKIAAHLVQRGAGWRTTEAPLDVQPALAGAGARDIVLLDCATFWLSNHILAETDLDAEQDRLLHAIAACPARVVVVSNEVGAGIVPENKLARRFRVAQGGLNQRIAQRADLVVTVMAGLPLVLKGTLPGGAI